MRSELWNYTHEQTNMTTTNDSRTCPANGEMDTAAVAPNPPIAASGGDDRLVDICRSPVHCPVAECRQMIGVTTVLTHFLRDHRPAIGEEFQEIGAEQRSLLVLHERYFARNADTTAIGVLVYAGRRAGETPVDCGLCRPNSFLPERYSRFTNHLPILILGCRCEATALLADREFADAAAKEVEEEGMHEEQSTASEADDKMLVIWLATVQTIRPLHCTITVFNADMRTSRSAIVRVRSLKDAQDPVDFLATETDYLALSAGELRLLRDDDRSSGTIELEIIVHELK